MQDVVRALACIDAVRALAPAQPAAPGFGEHLGASDDQPRPVCTAAAPPPLDTLGQFVGATLPPGGLPAAPATTGFVRPSDAEIGSRFGMRLHPILDVVRTHEGVDMGAPEGAPILAVADATVSFAGDRGGYGKAHQSVLAVRTGQPVAAGQLLGYVGSTRLSTVPHLHFEVRRDRMAVDPDPFLAST